jgi:HD-GYP domain-containing protein (c-di-GMP phosphodiesterase class II)
MTQVLIWGQSREMLAGEPFPGSPDEVDTLDALCTSLDGKGATLVLAEAARLEAEREDVQAWLENGAASQVVLVAVTDGQEGDAVLESLPFVQDVIARPVTPYRLERKLDQAHRALTSSREKRQLELAVHRKSKELETLNKIGVALSAERDINKLLERILTKSRAITGADAGSLYLVERDRSNGDTRPVRLRFKLAQNDSLSVPFKESTVPLDDSSIAGHAALSGELINVPDAYTYDPRPDSPFRASQAFDEKSGYRTKSMLVVPMRDHQNEVIGIVQLINKKRDPTALLRPVSMVDEEVIPFTTVDEQLAGSLASQAAVAFLNAKLLQDIRNLFKEFVTAAVTAIEKRDPTTSGHSERVAVLTVDLAQRVDGAKYGPYADLRLSPDQIEELRYASKLHDFGKVGVPERVLRKEKKLLASELRAIELRLAYRTRTLEAEHLRRKVEALQSRRTGADELAALDVEYEKRRRDLQRILDVVRLANEPQLVERKGIQVLDEAMRTLQSLPVRSFDSEDTELALPVEEWATGPILSERERAALLIRRGSLTDIERTHPREGINSHVQHTYEFLSKITWTGELSRIPEIAWAHHEKLDGSGYPRGITGAEIPVQAKMMTISDIYDALVAWDRPYKRAVSAEQALEILEEDVRRGQLDADLLTVFIEARVWDNPEFHELLQRPNGLRRTRRR